MGFGPAYVAHIPPLEGWHSRDSLWYGARARVAYITAKSKKKEETGYVMPRLFSGPATAGPGSQVTKGFRHGRPLAPGFKTLKLKLKAEKKTEAETNQSQPSQSSKPVAQTRCSPLHLLHRLRRPCAATSAWRLCWLGTSRCECRPLASPW